MPQVSTAVTTLPPPIKIDVSELLVKLPAKKADAAEANAAATEGTSSSHRFASGHIIIFISIINDYYFDT